MIEDADRCYSVVGRIDYIVGHEAFDITDDRNPLTNACSSSGSVNVVEQTSFDFFTVGGSLAELNPCDWQPLGPKRKRYRNFPTERGVTVARIHIQEASMAKREDA
jgi:hypothetical protein